MLTGQVRGPGFKSRSTSDNFVQQLNKCFIIIMTYPVLRRGGGKASHTHSRARGHEHTCTSQDRVVESWRGEGSGAATLLATPPPRRVYTGPSPPTHPPGAEASHPRSPMWGQEAVWIAGASQTLIGFTRREKIRNKIFAKRKLRFYWYLRRLVLRLRNKNQKGSYLHFRKAYAKW